MNIQDLCRLPLGTSDFAALREFGQIYVDKTRLVYSLASQHRKFFLCRPRRFGKSLLLSTFESLFSEGLKHFKGLAIEKLWKDEGEYQVLELDFSRVSPSANEASFPKVLEDYLDYRFGTIGFQKEKSGLDFYRQLECFIESFPASSLVLLIDEYDAPLTAALRDPAAFRRVREAFTPFYGVLKAGGEALRFLFITGITKFRKECIFSELNDLSDISMDSRFGELVGFTEKEIRTSFGSHLAGSAASLDVPEEALWENLKDEYEGYCFDDQASGRLFSPWSILNFLIRPEEGFDNYWIQSGATGRDLLRYFKSDNLKSPLHFASEKTMDLENFSLSPDPENLNELVLLTQAGYFTIKKVVDRTTLSLGYPNREVSESMARLYTGLLLQGKTLGQAGEGSVAELLGTGSPESVFNHFNRIFLSMDQQKYPVRLESEVQRLVQVFLAGAGLNPRVETVNALGRSDLEVTAGGRHWVLEFKVSREGENEERLLEEATEQIRSRKYGEDRGAGELVRMALVFSVRERQFVRWAAA